MNQYGSYSDDFYINMNLNSEMELPSNRETVLHYFEQIQRHYPSMRNFYNRERGEFILEEDKDQGSYRWASIEPRRICSGYINPTDVNAALNQHAMVLDIVPYALSLTSLDCESLNLMYGFDFTYRGNHNEVIAEALGMLPSFERLQNIPGLTSVCYEPSFQFAVDEDCRIQCRLSIETRTSAYHIRTREFPDEQLSVYLTARKYGSLESGESFTSTMKRLQSLCEEIIDGYMIEHILVPLQQTIAIK